LPIAFVLGDQPPAAEVEPPVKPLNVSLSRAAADTANEDAEVENKSIWRYYKETERALSADPAERRANCAVHLESLPHSDVGDSQQE
jgi:hypothetical protein